MPSKRKRCSICEKKLNPAQRIMAKCRCDKLICGSCKADHITQCPVVVDLPVSTRSLQVVESAITPPLIPSQQPARHSSSHQPSRHSFQPNQPATHSRFPLVLQFCNLNCLMCRKNTPKALYRVFNPTVTRREPAVLSLLSGSKKLKIETCTLHTYIHNITGT
jgi:hypothetical protein